MVDADGSSGAPRRPQLQRSARSLQPSQRADRSDGGGAPPPPRRPGRFRLDRSAGSRDLREAERVQEDMRGLLRHLQQASVTATRDQEDRSQFREFVTYLAGETAVPEPGPPGAADEVSLLKETNARLQRRLSDKEAENHAVVAELERHKKVQEQTRLRRDGTEGDADEWKDLYDGLADKAGELADENGELHARCRRLEEELRRQREEGAAARRSMDEATRLVVDMGEHLEMLIARDKALVKEYEEELDALADERDEARAAQEVGVAATEALRGEHAVLRAQFEEAARYYEDEARKARR